MSVTWRDRLRCWWRGHHRYETAKTERWPAGHMYRLCRTCGATKKWRPWHDPTEARGRHD